MKLHASPASSFSRKIRVLLIEKAIPHAVEMVNLWEPNQLQDTTPLGKVPALELGDGRLLVGSALIADYLDCAYPQPRFIPIEPDARLDVRRCEALADGTMDAVSTMLYEMRFHDEAKRSQAWLDRQRGKFEAGFATLEGMLGERPWCVGDAMSLADVAIACHIGFVSLRVPQHFPRDDYPRLWRLWQAMEGRESFRRTAPPAK